MEGKKLEDWYESFVRHLQSSLSKDEQGPANAINYAQFWSENANPHAIPAPAQDIAHFFPFWLFIKSL